MAWCRVKSLVTFSSVQALPVIYLGAENKCEICFLGEGSHLGLLFLSIELSSHRLISHSQD